MPKVIRTKEELQVLFLPRLLKEAIKSLHYGKEGGGGVKGYQRPVKVNKYAEKDKMKWKNRYIWLLNLITILKNLSLIF